MNWKNTILCLIAHAVLGVSASINAGDLDDEQPAKPIITPPAVFRHQPLDTDTHPANIFRRQACEAGRKQCGDYCIYSSNTCCYSSVECYTYEYCTVVDGHGACCGKGKSCDGRELGAVSEPLATGGGAVLGPSLGASDEYRSLATSTAGDGPFITSGCSSTGGAGRPAAATSSAVSGGITRVNFLVIILLLGIQAFVLLF